jgi:hypothetical protein
MWLKEAYGVVYEWRLIAVYLKKHPFCVYAATDKQSNHVLLMMMF